MKKKVHALETGENNIFYFILYFTKMGRLNTNKVCMY